MYNEFVVRGVKEKENFKTEDKDTAMQKTAMGNANPITDEDVRKLKNEAKELKDAGFLPPTKPYAGMKYETLLPLVEQARLDKATKERLTAEAKEKELVTT